jgi:hypothetical protein
MQLDLLLTRLGPPLKERILSQSPSSHGEARALVESQARARAAAIKQKPAILPPFAEYPLAALSGSCMGFKGDFRQWEELLRIGIQTRSLTRLREQERATRTLGTGKDRIADGAVPARASSPKGGVDGARGASTLL